MAKNTKKVTVEVNAVQASPKSSGPDPWQTREDVNDLMRPNMLRMDKTRYKKALDCMQKTLDHERKQLKGPRAKARAGRRTSARNIGKR